MKNVSIIVPIYNSEKYLTKMLESVANQTYPKEHLEVILVDDGSSDNSGEICRQFCKNNNNFKLISKPNGGVSSARNMGLDIAKGEYVTFFDSDDVIDKNYVLVMVNNLEKTNAQLVCSGIVEKSQKGINYFGYDKDKSFLITDEASYVDFFNDYWLPVLWNKMYVKQLITHKFDENIAYDEDTIFNLNYLKNVKKISCVKEKLYCYCIHNDPNSLTQKGINKIFDKSKITNEYRINLSKDIFKSKKAVYVACRKLIKAIFQEVKVNYENNVGKTEIMKIAMSRLQDEEVLKSFSYFDVIFDQDVVIKDIIENKDVEKLYDCAINGFEKYIGENVR